MTFFEGKEIGSQSGWENAFSMNLHYCKFADYNSSSQIFAQNSWNFVKTKP